MTQNHVERLKQVFEMLGETAQPKPCKAMMGLVEEGQEKEALAADLALIAAAQRVEPDDFRVSDSEMPRSPTRRVRLRATTFPNVRRRRSCDFVLTAISEPIVQQISLNNIDADVNPGLVVCNKEENFVTESP